MGYQPNPFEDDDELDMPMPMQLLQGLAPMHGARLGSNDELIKLFGMREGTITIDISRDNERGAERDAAVLEVILSTTLERDTMIKLCGIIYSKYIAPNIQLEEPKPTRKRRTKKDVSNSEDKS